MFFVSSKCIRLAAFLMALSVLSIETAKPQNNAASAGLAFLKVTPDARGIAMGGAQVASAAGAQALVWNPAGILNDLGSGSNSTSFEAAFTHFESFHGISHDFVGTALQKKAFAYAFGAILTSVSDIELRDERPTAEPLGHFGANFVAWNLAMAVRAGRRWQTGVGLKYIYEKIFHYSATGVAIDLGAQVSTPFRNITAGIVLQHLGRMGRLQDERTSLPTNFRIGLEGVTEMVLARWAVEGGVYRYGNAFAAVGAEFRVGSQAHLRAGYRYASNAKAFSTGVGVYIARYAFSYAFLPHGDDLGDTHQISANVRF